MLYFLALVLVVSLSQAETWHVPGDHATIQAALDNLSDGDTVVVEAATYPEALQAPGVTFALLGIIDPDENPDRPVIDPSPLPGSTHLACLTLPFQSQAVVSGFVFRNGSQMYPRDSFDDIGGILDNSDDLVLRRSVFDSTYKGLTSNFGTLTVDSCDFIDNVEMSIFDLTPAETLIRHSSFSGSTASGRLLVLGDHSHVEQCSFTNSAGGEWLWLVGQGITVHECEFGPTVQPAHAILWIPTVGSGWRITNNWFHDLTVTGPAIQFDGSATDTNYFQNNYFQQIHAIAQEAGAVSIAQGIIIAQNNVFDSCYAYSTLGFGALKLGFVNGSHFLHNQFIGPDNSSPHIRIDAASNVRFRGNSFSHTRWAMHSFDHFVDAESNWWGDPSGPVHVDNPMGLGDSVSGPVDFDLWLTEDPFDTTEFAPEPPVVFPSEIELEVYPNPFNASAILRLSVPRPGSYVVELYNTLGQRVQEVWSGMIERVTQIPLNAQALPSGIYFATLTADADTKQNAMSKIVVLK